MIAFYILGLPAHPLVVHGAVAFIPISALAVLVYVLRPLLRPLLWFFTLVVTAAAWLCALVAGSTGETLEHALPHSHFIHEHTQWAGYLGVAVHVLAAAALVVLVVD